GAEDIDGERRHPGGVRQGAGGGVAPLQGAGGMSEQRDKAPEAFLALISGEGFVDGSLRDVGGRAGMGLAELYRLYPDKVALTAAFMARVDTEVLAGVPHKSDPEETARDRLFEVLMRRYDALRPHRAALAAIRRAATRDPMLAIAIG